jgi:hypothetical protein
MTGPDQSRALAGFHGSKGAFRNGSVVLLVVALSWTTTAAAFASRRSLCPDRIRWHGADRGPARTKRAE